MLSATGTPCVLLVDDDDDALLLSQRLVEKAAPGALVLTARGAGAAMAQLLKASNPGDATTVMPDVILLDVNMPDIDGFELLRWVRRNQSLAAVKVVMLSNSEADADIKRAAELGAHGYLIKYPNAACLAALLRQATGTATPFSSASDGREAIRPAVSD